MEIRNLAIITALFLAHAVTACTSEKPPASDMDNDPVSEETLKNDSTDKAFIGLSEEKAQALAKDQNLRFRVVNRDGASLPATMDYRLDRVNATIIDGKITATRRG